MDFLDLRYIPCRKAKGFLEISGALGQSAGINCGHPAHDGP